jgi:two-component system LytT family sensor kinase
MPELVAPHPPLEAALRKHARLFWTACFVGWCALVALTASTLFAFKLLPLSLALQLAVSLWGPYALLAPAVLWWARRFPLTPGIWRRNLGAHLVGALVFVVVSETGFAQLVHRLEPQAQAILADRQRRGIAPMDLPDPVERLAALTGDPVSRAPRPTLRLVAFKSQFSLPLYWVLVGVAHTLAAMGALREREQQAAQLAAHLAQAQLAGLRTQLQPHFLFNTLNSIAALIPQNARLATEMVLNLSDLLRMTLREPQRLEIPLREELTLLQHYVDIQRLRFGERLAFQVEITEEAREVGVPPLVLQPLVENAIRHGLEASDQPELITVLGRIQGPHLVLQVTNTFRAAPDGARSSPPSTGLGLANTQARLRAQFGEHQSFQAGPLPDGGFQVTLHTPATPLPPSVSP